MSIHKHLSNLERRDRLIEEWYKIWKKIGKLIQKPYSYLCDRRLKKLSNPDYYNREKLLNIIEKQMAKELFIYAELYLMHNNDICVYEVDNIDTPYTYIKNSDDRYMTKYRRYALRNDRNFDWVQYIIDNIDLEYEVKTGKDFIGRYNSAYHRYKDIKVYVFKLK